MANTVQTYVKLVSDGDHSQKTCEIVVSRDYTLVVGL